MAWWDDLLNLGSKALGIANNSDSRSNLADVISQQENNSYKDTNSYNSAVTDYNKKYQDFQRGEIEASNAASGARRAAQMANDKKAAVAAGKASNTQQSGFDSAIKQLSPFVLSANQLLPQMQKSYEGGLDTASLLKAYLTSPKAMAALNPTPSPLNTNIQLPSYLRR